MHGHSGARGTLLHPLRGGLIASSCRLLQSGERPRDGRCTHARVPGYLRGRQPKFFCAPSSDLLPYIAYDHPLAAILKFLLADPRGFAFLLDDARDGQSLPLDFELAYLLFLGLFENGDNYLLRIGCSVSSVYAFL